MTETPGRRRGPSPDMPSRRPVLRAAPRLLALLGLLAAVFAAATPSPATAQESGELSVGIADQKTTFFTAPLFQDLHISKVRRVVPWDAMNIGYERAELDQWLTAARAASTRPLLSFGHSRVPSRAHTAPTPAQFVASFRKLRKAYPWVTEFAVWNEPNLCGEPLCHKPELAARYYDALRAACPSCTILASEVLDNPTMTPWVKAFLKRVKHKPTIWGLHNYLDANRLRTSGTQRLLRLVTGQIWFTETGGIVKRRSAHKQGGFPETVAHAAVAMRWIFDKLVELSPRIKRVYIYHWNPGGPRDSWDSGLVGLDGTARTGYRVLRDRLRTIERRRAASAARHRVAHG